jgi:hypothetical protein
MVFNPAQALTLALQKLPSLVPVLTPVLELSQVLQSVELAHFRMEVLHLMLELIHSASLVLVLVPLVWTIIAEMVLTDRQARTSGRLPLQVTHIINMLSVQLCSKA